jgi:predicted phosphate transport protein (TIGR00153 family)
MAHFVRKFFTGLFGAQHEIQRKLDDYLERLDAMAADLPTTIAAYLNQDADAFKSLFARINETEHGLDNLRREIEEEIYGRSLLPDTRGDILGLLEAIDKIPNRMQSLTREMALQNIRVPRMLHPSLLALANRDALIVGVLISTVRSFLDRPAEVKQGAKEISRHEHEGDVIEQEALALTFEEEALTLAHQLQLHRLIEGLGSICDIAEDVGDRLVIAALKRIL